MNISIDFHLFQFKQTFTLPDNSQKIMEYKSHGGRLTVLWLIVSYIMSLVNATEFSFWGNFKIGFGLAIVWDVITIGIYFFRTNLYEKKLKQSLETIMLDTITNKNGDNVATIDEDTTMLASNIDKKVKAIEEEFAEDFAALDKMEKEKEDK